MQIHFKATDATSGTTRRFSWTFHSDDPNSYNLLQSHLATTFSLSVPLTLAYHDTDNDVITFSSQPELSELAHEVQSNPEAYRSVRLLINPSPKPATTTPSPPEPTTAEPTEPTEPMETTEPQRSTPAEDIFSDFSNFFSTLGSAFTPPPPPGGPRQGHHRGWGRRQHHHPHPRPWGPPGMNWMRYLDEMISPSPRPHRRPHHRRAHRWNRPCDPMSNVSEEVRRAVEELVQHARSTPSANYMALLPQLPQVFAMLRQFVQSTPMTAQAQTQTQGAQPDVPTTVHMDVDAAAEAARTAGEQAAAAGMQAAQDATAAAATAAASARAAGEQAAENAQAAASQAAGASARQMDDNTSRVETLVQGIEAIVRPVIGDDLTARVTRVVRAGVNDDAVLNFVRNIPREGPWSAFMEAYEEEEGETGATRNARPPFDIHRRVECDSCGCQPIVGVRYKCTNKADYDICALCYGSDDVNKEGLEFRECKYVWEARFPDSMVPPAPLKIGSKGPDVLFLHKVLKDLGYGSNIPLNGINGYLYTHRTVEAVRQFQRDFRLDGVTEIGKYDETTQASLMSIMEAQVPPSTATGGASASDGNGNTPMTDAQTATPAQPETQG